MAFRSSVALLVCLVISSTAAGQVVRFQTTVGDFDMVLNPTKNPLLQEHVDNMVRYVEDNRYRGVWINRAAEDFVLQMGGFYAHTKRPVMTTESIRPVATFEPVRGVPAATISGLSNTIGTVSLALPGDGMGGTNRNAGTSSFFVNLRTNDFLDSDFTVFAAIPDLTVINEIMALSQVDRTQDPMFGADPGNLAFSDVPLQDDGFQVFIKRAFLITDTLAVARAMAGVQSAVNLSAETFQANTSADSLLANVALEPPASTAGGVSAAATGSLVPEPAAGLLLLLGGVVTAAWLRTRRR